MRYQIKHALVQYGADTILEDVNFEVHDREKIAIVGRNGCGKTTLGRTILRLYEPTGGSIIYDGTPIYENPLGPDGKPVGKASAVNMLPYRRKMQIIFQDPMSSLDPRMTVGDIIAEPLRIQKERNKAVIEEKVRRLMDTVGIAERLMDSYPHELDGGRRQRIGIARALALDPRWALYICL